SIQPFIHSFLSYHPLITSQPLIQQLSNSFTLFKHSEPQVPNPFTLPVKMLFSNILTFALGLSVSTVSALPAHADGQVASLETRNLEARALSTALKNLIFQDAFKAISRYGPPPTLTMMHSGIGPKQAFQVAKGKGLGIVESAVFKAVAADKASSKPQYKETLQKFCVTKAQFTAGESGCAHTEGVANWVDAWAEISRAWASYAQKSTVLATTQQGPRRESFYATIEKPTLQGRGIPITEEKKYPAGS
ncbi:hypothetical protein BU24DRAFT_479697, partial [Aaosphaeria arxii CBS 175.79]